MGDLVIIWCCGQLDVTLALVIKYFHKYLYLFLRLQNLNILTVFLLLELFTRFEQKQELDTSDSQLISQLEEMKTEIRIMIYY